VSDHRVSPPASGMTMALRMEPSGALDEGHIGVPLVTVPVDRGGVGRVHADEGAGPGVVDLEHLFVLVDARDDRVGVGQLAEGGGEALVLGGGEVLLGEEDDLVVEQGLADGAHGGRFELDVEVEAADHPTNGPRERLDVELDGGAGGAGRGHDEVLSGWRELIMTKPIDYVKKQGSTAGQRLRGSAHG